MRMQPAPTTSGYGLGYTPTTPLRPEAGNSFVPAADNVHDIWWTQRRARQRVRAGTAQGAPAAKPEPPVALDQAGVEQVLTEFVQSMYAATLFRNFRCEPTDYGQIAGSLLGVMVGGMRGIVFAVLRIGPRRHPW